MSAARHSFRTDASTTGKENEKTMSSTETATENQRPSRRGRLAGVALFALTALLALAGPAAAKVVHTKEGSIPVNASGIAVDNSGGASAGDVWVASEGVFSSNGKVAKYSESGSPTGVEFTGSGTPAGSLWFLDFGTFTFGDPLGIDSSAGANAGDVYVADTAHKVIDRFSEAGAYECQITGKSSASASECAGAASPVPGGAGFTPAGVTVNPSDGHVFVTDAVSHKVFEFKESGEYEGEIADAHLTVPRSLSFDAAGNLYVVNGSFFFGGVNVVKFDSSGVYESTLTSSGGPLSLSVDRGNGHVYVGGASGVRDFDSSGADLGSFSSTSTPSLSANNTSHRVYIPDAGFTVGIYSGPQAIPDVTTKPATNVEEVTATVNGEVDLDAAHGGGNVTSCEFEYGTTTSYGSSAPCSPATPYAATQSVSAGLFGLASSTTYHFRLKASNANGIANFGADQTFITKGPPAVGAESVEGITRSGATLKAEINPNGYATSYIFEYVTQAHYEAEGFANPQATAPEGIGSGQSPVAVSKAIGGLSVATKYHYRAKATNSHGTVPGADQTFDTVPVAAIEGEYAVVGLHTAKLEVDVNPLGLDTDCHFEWVPTSEYQESGYANATVVPCEPEDLGSGSSRSTGKINLSGLPLSTGYHYRAVVSNSSGAVSGKDEAFTTFGVKSFDFELEEEPAGGEEIPGSEEFLKGEPVTQAGAHPWALVSTIYVNRTNYREHASSTEAVLKDVLNELPAGLIGNPEATPKCKLKTVEERKCGGDSHVGFAEVFWEEEGVPLAIVSKTARIYNTIPPKGKAALFAGEVNASIDAFIASGIRTGEDYGINSGAAQIINEVELHAVRVTIWGVPADHSHDTHRECGFANSGCVSNAEPKALLRLPTSCSGKPLIARAKVNSYQDPNQYVYATDELPAVTGCNQLEFEPTVEARPTTKVADSPTGLHVDIHNPQNEDPEGLGTPDVKDVEVALPQGLIVNPAGANGLQGCTPAQADLHSPDPSKCPDGAKIGTAEVDTPLLDHPLKGGMYIATPHDNPFNSLLATYIALDDPQTGVVVKLAGEVKADPVTGQLTATFKDNPQLPFNDFKVDLFSGALAPLRTPPTCGTFSTKTVMTPWSAPDSGPPAEPADSYQIDSGPNGSGCASNEGAQPNSPSFDAGAESPIGGKYSPFVVNLRREDGSQQFKDVTVTPPPGLVAKLAGTPYCPDAALAAAAGRSGVAEKASPSCPAASRIGTVNVSAGAGPAPYYVQGTAYMAGPYKGDPLSLAIVTPATAGPFDLGTVVVRAALHVDPETAQITAKADPVPHILEGIPLDIRSVALKLDKPGFSLNPTSCDPMSVGGNLVSVLGQSASLSDRFQLGDCASLAFKPKLETRLTGKTNRGAHPSFKATVTMPQGGANIAKASVKLPRSEILDQGHIRTICTRVQFAADACPAGSIYGYAVAQTPLLEQPLEGPVYLRSSDHKLPDLVADLRGQIHIAVVGRIDSVGGGIRNTFEAVPDAPVSKFTLTMKGGAKGLLQNSTNICKGTHDAIALFDGQNGAVSDSRPPLLDSKCAAAKRTHRRHHKRGGGAQG